MRTLIAMVGVALLLAAGCSDDDSPGGDGAVLDTGGTGADQLLWPDAKLKLDTVANKCTGTSSATCGAAPKTMQCVSGVCTPCSVYYYNCDKVGVCECAGACDGAKCVGTRITCKFDDKSVCGGATSKYCDKDKCVDCPKGTQNCDKTKDCECTTGCAGTKCK